MQWHGCAPRFWGTSATAAGTAARQHEGVSSESCKTALPKCAAAAGATLHLGSINCLLWSRSRGLLLVVVCFRFLRRAILLRRTRPFASHSFLSCATGRRVRGKLRRESPLRATSVPPQSSRAKSVTIDQSFSSGPPTCSGWSCLALLLASSKTGLGQRQRLNTAGAFISDVQSSLL